MQRNTDWPWYVKAMTESFIGLGFFNQYAAKENETEYYKFRIEYYWTMLEDLSCVDVVQGLRQACRYTTKTFPLPGVIREHAERARVDRLAREARDRQLADRRLLAEGGDLQALGLAQVQHILEQLGAHMSAAESRRFD